jgi:hypothetical protein
VTETVTPAQEIDSRVPTLFHSLRVGHFMTHVIKELVDRSVVHDFSKTQPPEVDGFDRATAQLSSMAYGSPEYDRSRAELMPTLEHHYAKNRHHPEFFGDRGINGMTLADLVEMLADWRASTERMGGTGDLRESIRLNAKRFGIEPQLAEILVNTAEHFGWIPPAGE